MKAPNLNRKLLLEAPQKTPDGAGGYTISWAPLGTLFGALIAQSGREAAGFATPLSRVPYKIIVRAAPIGAASRPQAGQRLRDGVRIFAIVAMAEYDPGGRYLTCHAQEETTV